MSRKHNPFKNTFQFGSQIRRNLHSQPIVALHHPQLKTECYVKYIECIDIVTTGEKIPEVDGYGKLVPLLVVAALILLVILVLGVLVARRKREHSTLWFPEGFGLKKESSNKNRREPVGQDALGMK